MIDILLIKLQKTFVFQGNSHIMESFQPYSEYLEIEKELRELQTLENEISKEVTSEKVAPIIKKQTKLSYKRPKRYDMLPKEIEDLELKLDEINACLMNPKCYEQKELLRCHKNLKN